MSRTGSEVDAPLGRWDSMFQSGVRAHYLASACAARMMADRRRGLIVNISFRAAQNNATVLLGAEMHIQLSDLIEYTHWERRKWHEWLPQHGSAALELTAGPNGDGRFTLVGDLVRHIFSAEQRYVQRLKGQPVTDATAIPNTNIEALFEFGRRTRQEFETLLETFPEAEWDIPKELKILDFQVEVTPRKVVTHVLMHEIRHWAQIATLWRLNGMVDEFHDLIASPVMGGHWKRKA